MNPYMGKILGMTCTRMQHGREGIGKHRWFGKQRYFNYDFPYYFKKIYDFDFYCFLVICQIKLKVLK